jgi:transcriptional regulator with XRE-family HTH domain
LLHFLARISHRPLGSEAVVSEFPGSDESKRARRLREAMGFNGRGDQQKFAELLGVERGRWNNIECGAPLSKEMAMRIVRKFPGVTLDWLFLGRPEGLTVEIARALSEPSKGNDAHGDSPSSLASYR